MSAISSVGSSYSSLLSSVMQRSGKQAAGATGTGNPLQQVFNSIDSDQDGSLSSSELGAALSASADTTQSGGATIDIEGLLGMLDSDGGGTVSESEFAQAMAPPPPPAGGQDASALLGSLDTNGDGQISADELSAASSGDSDGVSQLMSSLDSDDSGSLSLDELQAGMKPHGPPPPPPMADAGDSSTASGSTDDSTTQAYNALMQLALGQYRSAADMTGSTSQLNLAA